MTFPPPVSVIKRVKYLSIHVRTRGDGRGYTDADRCSLLYVSEWFASINGHSYTSTSPSWVSCHVSRGLGPGNSCCSGGRSFWQPWPCKRCSVEWRQMEWLRYLRLPKLHARCQRSHELGYRRVRSQRPKGQSKQIIYTVSIISTWGQSITNGHQYFLLTVKDLGGSGNIGSVYGNLNVTS